MPNLEDDIKRCITEFSSAWNQHNGKRLAELFADEGDLIDPWGHPARGKAEVEAYFCRIHAGQMSRSTNDLRISHIESLRPDVCIVDCEGKLAHFRDEKGEEMPDCMHHVTFTMRKEGDNWLIASARPVIYAGQGPVSMAEERTPAGEGI